MHQHGGVGWKESGHNVSELNQAMQDAYGIGQLG